MVCPTDGSYIPFGLIAYIVYVCETTRISENFTHMFLGDAKSLDNSNALGRKAHRTKVRKENHNNNNNNNGNPNKRKSDLVERMSTESVEQLHQRARLIMDLSDKKHERLVLAAAQYSEHYKTLSSDKDKEFEKATIIVTDMKNIAQRQACKNWRNYLSLDEECTSSRLKWNNALSEAEEFRKKDASYQQAATLLSSIDNPVDKDDVSIDLTSPVPTRYLNTKNRSATPHSEITGLTDGNNSNDGCSM